MPKPDLSDTKEVARAMVAEFFSTAFMVFWGCGAFLSSGAMNNYDGSQNFSARHLPISFAFGFGTTFLLYSVGEFTEGFMNPAVVVFLMAIKKITPGRAAVYIVTQVAAAILAPFLLWIITSDAGVRMYNLGANTLSPDVESGQGFLLELMGTLMLLLTIQFTWVVKGGPALGKPSLAYLCIGLSVFVAHLLLYPLTGCGINPARTFGPALMGIFAHDDSDVYFADDCWIYYLGPLLAAVVATGVHFIYDIDEHEKHCSRDSARQQEL